MICTGFFILKMSEIIYIIVGLSLGYTISFFVSRAMSKNKSNKFLKEAKSEAEVFKKDKVLQAKEKFFQLKEEHEKTIGDRERKMIESLFLRK